MNQNTGIAASLLREGAICIDNMRKWFAHFVKDNVISEMPENIAACEYCGRKTTNPEGCENIGNNQSESCKYGNW